MRCVFCKYEETKVLETRDTGSDVTRRRRQCLKCEKRFTTYEQFEFTNIGVIKRNDTREIFDRQKVVKSIELAAQKRPIKNEDIELIAGRIEADIREGVSKEVSSIEIGEKIMSELKKIDEVAYIRFASVYRDFKDIDSFKEELDELSKRK